MSEAAIREAVVAEHLRGLKMPGAAREYQSLARDGGWAYEEFLRQVLEAEMRSRQERTATRRLREARFPDIKTLDQLDWDALTKPGRCLYHGSVLERCHQSGINTVNGRKY